MAMVFSKARLLKGSSSQRLVFSKARLLKGSSSQSLALFKALAGDLRRSSRMVNATVAALTPG
jgi:hypothetical protein